MLLVLTPIQTTYAKTHNSNIRVVQVVKDQQQLNKDIMLLAKLINSEALGEPYQGKLAVGNVVMNRVKSREFPNSITEVVYQKGQFDGVGTKYFNDYPHPDSIKAAIEAIEGKDITSGALFHVNLNKVNPKWAYTLTFTGRIGDHWFYKK
jgi:N-acetylmuramoyl-L-alanine amidase